MRRTPEEKARVLSMARDGLTPRVINEVTGVASQTIRTWCVEAGVEIPRERARPGTTSGGEKPKTLGNLPLALRINERVERRLREEREAEEREEESSTGVEG